MKNIILIVGLLCFLYNCNNSSTSMEIKNKEWIPFAQASSSVYFLIDKNTIGSGDNPDIEKESMPEIDVPSFEIWKGTEYARDKNRVYYPINLTCLEFEGGNDGMCFYNEYILQNANPKTFEYLGKEYAKDGKLFFHKGKKIDNMDEKTIQQLIAQ